MKELIETIAERTAATAQQFFVFFFHFLLYSSLSGSPSTFSNKLFDNNQTTRKPEDRKSNCITQQSMTIHKNKDI